MQEQMGYGCDAAGNLNYRTNNALIQTFNVNSLNEPTTGTGNTTNAPTVAGATSGGAASLTLNGQSAALYLGTFAVSPWLRGEGEIDALLPFQAPDRLSSL